MKHWLREKINNRLSSESGASLSVALLFFIVCAVVGSVILAAASSSMGRMKNLQERDQEREMLSSAARLVADRMSSGALFDEEDYSKLHSSLGPKASSGDGTITVQNGRLSSTSTFVYYMTSDGSYYWQAGDNGGLPGKITVKDRAPESDLSEDNEGPWPWETWPAAPDNWTPKFDDTSLTLRQLGVNSLTSYRNAWADSIISYYWGMNTASPENETQQSRYLLKNWRRNSIPSNESWRYAERINESYFTQSTAAELKPVSGDDPINELLKGKSFTLTISNYNNQSPQTHVDLFMDQFLNVEAQIFTKKTDSENPEKTISSFDEAPMRYLVKIPAKTGEVGYSQTEQRENAKDQSGDELKVASWSTSNGTNVVREMENQVITAKEYQRLLSDPMTVIKGNPSDILKVTVTRTLTLDNFGWDASQVSIYTGASVEEADDIRNGYIVDEQ